MSLLSTIVIRYFSFTDRWYLLYISCSQYLLTWIENNDWDMTSKRSEFCTALWIIHSNLWKFSFSIQHCFPSLDQLINVHRLDQHIYSMDSIWNSRWLWVACILFLRALVIYWAIICYVMVASGNRATSYKTTGQTRGTLAQWRN